MRAERAIVFLLAAAAALAAPALTTIQDVLYKADGTRFNGIAIISWSSFEAADLSNITAHTTTVKIVDGNLRVQLAPTTNAEPPRTYLVKYNSDGRVQFEETWAVPPSASPLRVRDVRVAAPPPPTVTPGAISESDVIGLAADLAARPAKGPGYAPGRTVLANATGALEGVSGNLADCVRVDGTSGPCGSPDPPPGFVDSETPGGIVDGANTAFQLASAPEPSSSLALFRNGILQKAGQDFSVTGYSIQFLPVAIPQPGDTLLASYRLAGTPSSLVVSGPAVLCNGSGASTSSINMASLGTCVIPAATLKTGDRVEVRFDYSHDGGTATGFTFALRWGATTLVQRIGGPAETLVAGRAEAAIQPAGAQLSVQTWGALLPLLAGMAASADSPLGAITLDFRGWMAAATVETLTLRNFTVIRYSR